MPGIGDQRHGIGEHAVGELHRDESQIEADTDGEGRAEACGSVDMGAPVMVMIGALMHVMAIKRLMWAHGGHETSTQRVMIYASTPYMHPPRGHTSQFRPAARVCGLAATCSKRNAPARFLCGG